MSDAPTWLREELAPFPGRWREAAAIAAASTTALGIALFVQFGSFPAPVLAFKALQPGMVSTWRNLWPRLFAIAGSAVFVTFAAGILVQLSWLLIPAFFALIAAAVYLVPLRTYPIAGYALALTLAGVIYTGIYAPQAIAATALSMSVAFAIGVLVATVFEQLGATLQPRDQLSAALAGSLARARDQVAAARVMLDAPPPGGDVAMGSDLATHLQLLTLVRQDTHDRVLDRGFVALMTVVERAALFAVTAEAAARHPARPDFRAALAPALDDLLDAIDAGLARYIAACADPASVVLPSGAAPAPAPWPDFSALLAALRARHADPALLAALGPLDPAASAALNGFLQALEGLSDVLHLAPEQLEHLPQEGPRPAPRRLLPPYDPFAFQFACKVGLASAVALLVGTIANTPAMETVVLNPLILAQGSYGATLRKAWLRITGVVAGGALAVLAAAAVMANVDNVAVWLTAFFVVMVPCAYVSLGSARTSYFGLQVAATFMIVMVANRPVTDIHEVLWRFWGTLVGAAVLFGIFALVAPDTAGRQVVSRLMDLVRALLDGAPVPGQPIPSLARTRASSDRITAGLADVLRLAGELRFEGQRSHVDADAAVNSAGVLRRIAHRWALIRHGRRNLPRPPLPAALAETGAALEHGLLRHLERLLDVLAARHHRARPGSQRDRDAIAAARALVDATDLPDLDAAWATHERAMAAARADLLATWPIAAREALFAEHGHLRRITDLMPKLERDVRATIFAGRALAAPV